MKMNSEPATAASTTKRRRLPLRHCFPVAIWLSAIGVILWSQTNELLGTGYRTAFAAGSIFVASASTLIWFSFFTRFPQALRVAVFCLCLVTITTLALVFRIEAVSGGLIPKLTFRWSPDRDEAMERIETQSTGIDLKTTTPFDFPQFLGPNRDLVVADDRLQFDWRQAPPRLIWKSPIGAGWSAFSAVNGYAVTMEQRGAEEITSCYEIATGKAVWASSVPARHETVLGGVGPRSTPTIHAGRVYALGASGVLRCLDGANGAEIWQRDLLQEFGVEDDKMAIAWGRSASPLIVDDRVVVPAGGPAEGRKYSLVAYDQLTGEERWRGGDQQISYASPTLTRLLGRRQILTVVENYVCGHDPETGEMLWDFSWPGNSTAQANNSQAIPVDDRRIFISKGYGQGAALFQVQRDASGNWSTEEIWGQRTVMKTKYSNVVVAQGHVYGLDDTFLECIELETGRKRWKVRYDYGQVLLVGSTLLVLDENGKLFAVQAKPEQHACLGELQALDGLTWNNICLYDRYLLVRNGQEAGCYQLATKAGTP